MDIDIAWTAGGNAPADVVTFIARIDGTAVTVGTQSAGPQGWPLVVLRAQSPMLDVLSVVPLVPDEAHRLAALLSSAALASVGRSALGPPAGVPPDGTPAGGVPGDARPTDVRSRHIVSAGEGSTAAQIRHALAHLPVAARLVDFVSDTDVALVFTTDDGDG